MKFFNLFSTWLGVTLMLLIWLLSLHPGSAHAEDLQKVTIKVGWMLCEK